MKIIAIGRNYADHIAELNNERSDAPVIFLKPDTALLKNNAAFYYPGFSNEVHHEVEVIVKIAKEGRHVSPKFAHRYFEEIGLGIDFTARDLQAKAKEKGLPWDLAKGFNGAAPISKFVPKEQFEDVQNIDFSLKVNGELRQQGNTKLMLWSIEEIICYISQFITLRKGDIIFTGTPKGVGEVKIGDRLEGMIGDEKFLDFEVK